MNSSRKRKRGKKTRSTFPFAQLPAELQSSIVELACQPRLSSRNLQHGSAASPSYAASNRPAKAAPLSLASETDLPSTLSLTLTSRGLYNLVVSTLYRNVHIGRPSVLQALQSTLASRPVLGRLIASLHFGPADGNRVELYGDYRWPVKHNVSLEDPRRSYQCASYFSSSLTRSCDEDLIPEWCKDEDLQWPLEGHHSPPDCRGRAISDALSVIQEAIDVDLGEEPYSKSRKNVGSVSTLDCTHQSLLHRFELKCPLARPPRQSLWVQRMLEAQAALDLFLAGMRRREEASVDYSGSWRAKPYDPSGDASIPAACTQGRCGHYPQLQLTGYPTPPQDTATETSDAHDVLLLSRTELLAHLARPGSRTDRFDHHLLFLTSGAPISDLYSNGRAGGGSDAHRGDREPPQLHNSDFESCASGALMLQTGIDVAIHSTASVASLLGLARSILSFTPNVKVLSLTGVFERLACGDHLPPQLPALRSLSIGPQPPHWRTPLRLSHPVLRQVKTLRLAGMMLYEEEVKALAELLDRGRLERLEYVMADHFSHRHSIKWVGVGNG